MPFQPAGEAALRAAQAGGLLGDAGCNGSLLNARQTAAALRPSAPAAGITSALMSDRVQGDASCAGGSVSGGIALMGGGTPTHTGAGTARAVAALCTWRPAPPREHAPTHYSGWPAPATRSARPPHHR